MFPRSLPLKVSLAAALLLTGCSLKSVALHTTVDILEEGLGAFYEEKDPAYARESLPGQLKLLEVFLKNEPGNEKLLQMASQGFAAYAFLFLEESEPERAKGFYARGRDYGLGLLKAKSGADFKALTDAAAFDEALRKLSARDVPALFWTAYAWGGLANLSRDDPDTLAELPRIEKMMLRVSALSPGYFYGGADVFLGAYYGSRPKMFGGDLEKSKAYFEKAVQASAGKFLMARLLYARFQAVPAQDRETFAALLRQVLDFDNAGFAEQRLSNEIAKLRAKKLLEGIDEHF